MFKALEKSEIKNVKLKSAIKIDTSDAPVEHIDNIKKIEKENNSKTFMKAGTKPHESLITVNKPNSVEAEQFRLIKNTIFFPDSGIPPKTIMITSSDESEGKSFVAANLAASIALSIDQYVLLMDCDLRHPTVHSMFGIDNSNGLSGYLQSDDMSLSSVFIKTFLDKLTILPGGEPPLNPSELVSSEQMKRLIEEAKNRYDDRYIILDAPPPYMTSETNALATYVDGIILVVKQGFTSKKKFKDIVDIYGKEKIIGVVKNFSKGMFGTGYGYKRRYEYSNNKRGSK